ncbi:MAG: NAD(P)H-hydrate dehydratase [Candidatus Bilamarchaeaceae archaeon]
MMGKLNGLKLWKPEAGSHKGQNGVLAIVGGGEEYHGAPMFSILAARRFVDLVYFIPGEWDGHLIDAVKTIPEAIVLDENREEKLIKRCDCVLFGIGLGDDTCLDYGWYAKNAKRLVVDGDGLKLAKEEENIPPDCILTPHEREFQMLFGLAGTRENVKEMARENRCVILKKGVPDIISDGEKIYTNDIHDVGMTKGGTGDVLAGLVAALFCKNDALTAARAAAYINGAAGMRLSKRFGPNYCASDLAEMLAEAANLL